MLRERDKKKEEVSGDEMRYRKEFRDKMGEVW